MWAKTTSSAPLILVAAAAPAGPFRSAIDRVFGRFPENRQRPMRAQSRSSAHVADVRNEASANEWRIASHHAGSYAKRRASAHAAAPRMSSAASAAMIAAPVEMRRPLPFFRAGDAAPTRAPAALPSGLPADGDAGVVAVAPPEPPNAPELVHRRGPF